MLILNPKQVVFAGLSLDPVKSLVIERRATRLIVEHADTGPHVAFVDCPEVRVTMRVTQDLIDPFEDSPKPGDTGTIAATISTSGSDAGRRSLSATGVVTQVSYEVSPRVGALRMLEFVLVSSIGAADPVTITPI